MHNTGPGTHASDLAAWGIHNCPIPPVAIAKQCAERGIDLRKERREGAE
jgi:hypothetical protein